MTTTTTEHDAEGWRERDRKVIAPCYRRFTDLVVERAEGAHVHTVDGRDILDFGSGIAVVNLGHGHPAVTAAVRAQIETLVHTSVTALNMPAIRAAEALVSVAPRGLERALDQVFFCSSGAEAIEAALKLARKATRRTDVIAFEGAFHGRTYGALSVTSSQRKYRAGIGPFVPGVHFVPYPSGSIDVTADAMERLFTTRLDPEDVAAVVVEPVLGEGGYVVPPPEFLPWLRRLCDEHGILLVVDEIQSGLGRCGRMFAVEHSAVVPDILCVAKALGNGFPIGAIVAGHERMGAWKPGDHGTTFGGNPVACAAAAAVIDTLRRDDLPARAALLGSGVLERLRHWQAAFPVVSDVRGLGLMIGIELASSDHDAGQRLAERVRARALERGLLVLGCGTFGNVIRLVPPLTIPESELERGLDILEACLRETS